MSYIKDRYDEVLDGRQSWEKKDDAGGDADLFLTQFVIPLRQLKADKMFDKLAEHKASNQGRQEIDRIDIVGAINLDHPQPEDED